MRTHAAARPHRTSPRNSLATTTATVALLACLAPVVAAQEAKAPAADAALRLGDALVLVAATRGEAAAVEVARDLPERLKAALRATARSPRVADVRDLEGQLDLQGAMVPALIDETPGARGALRAFATDASARLERELAAVARETARVRAAVEELAKDAVVSRLAVAARKGGPELLLLAAQAPLLTAELARAPDAPARYAALAGHFERRTDPLVGATLVALARALEQVPRELRAVGDRGEVAGALRDAERRLADAATTLSEAAARATEVVQRVRDEELTRVVQQSRGAELEQAVRMYSAYRRQFREPPALQATRFADVYSDRTSARLHFWLDGEDRWVQGPSRVDPLPPVVQALLEVDDPDLRARAVDPAALARVYLLYDLRVGRSRPFAEGLAATVARAQAGARQWRALRALGVSLGLDAAAVEEALLTRTGLAPQVLGLDDEPTRPARGAPELDRLVASRFTEALLRAAVLRGPEAGADLAAAVEAAADELEALKVAGASLALEGAPAGAAIDLDWSPDPEGPQGRTFLVRPRDRLPAGAEARVGALIVLPAQGAPPRVEVSAHAWTGAEDGRVLTARAALRLGAGQATSARLEPAPGPALLAVGGLGPRGLRILQVPREAPALDLHLQVGGAEKMRRPLAPAPGGAWAALTPEERGGDCEVVGLDAAGAVRARLALTLPPGKGVRLTSTGPGGAWWVAPNGAVEARVLSNGDAVGGRHTFRVAGASGVAFERTAETLRFDAELAPGRYLLAVEGAEPAPLAVMTEAPRVSVVPAPHRVAGRAGAQATVPAGGHAFLRLDAWPALLAEEVLRVQWTIEGGPEPLRAVTRASAAAPWAATVLPLRLEAAARPGPRRVVAAVETARGTLSIAGGFVVGPAARTAELELLASDGERLRALALGGDGALLRARPSTGGRDATWVVVGPTGRARALSPRFDGQVPLAFHEHDLPGVHEVWLLGDGPTSGRLQVLVHRPASLTLTPPADARIGQEVALAVSAPAGFEGPLRARLEGGGAWVDGARVTLTAGATNDVTVVLEDAKGRRARGRVTFAATREAPADPVSSVRYGIAANVTQRRLFAADHDQLQAYKRNQNLPRDWVVLELGPLPAAKVRDRMFATLPFDGPGADSQVAYRSRRFWASLQESARRGLLALGVREGDVFEVLDSPSPGGEETLDALVARHLAEHGAWEYRLVRVRVAQADGAVADATPPRNPQDELRLFKVSASGEGGTVERVEVPGPFGDLRLRPLLPATLTLGRTERLAFTTLSTRAELVAGRRYPGGVEALLPDALLCTELEVDLDVEGRRAKTTARRVGRRVGGVDVGVAFAHAGTDRVDEVAGQPRRAERYDLVLEPFTQEGAVSSAIRFEPIAPGPLENVAKTVVVTVRARLLAAVPLARWPADRPKQQPVTIEGAPFVLLREGLPDIAIELQATYQRQAPDALKPWPAVLPPVGAIRSGSEDPPPPIDGAAALAAALAALDRGELDGAEEAARRAVYTRPADAAGWAALADVLLQRRRPLEALGRARWSLALGATPRGFVVAGEAAWADGRFEEARAAVEATTTPTGDARLDRRLERLRSQLGL